MNVLTTDLETAYGTLPVLHTTADGVELTPEDRSREIYFAESNEEIIFADESACYSWYNERGNLLCGTRDLVGSQSFGEWLGDEDFSTSKDVA